MTSFSTPFEIHVHGEVPLREDVDFKAFKKLSNPSGNMRVLGL